MKAYLIVFMLNSFIIYELLVRAMRKIFQTKNKNQGKIFLCLAFLVALIHFSLYAFNKEKNYFQKMEIPRIFNPNELKKTYRQIQRKFHPDKILEKSENDVKNYIQLQEIHELLSNNENKEIYDKFGSKNDKLTDSKVHEEKDQANLIFALAEGGLIYTVYFIFSIILTYDENVKASRKWLILLIVIGIILELFHYFLKDLKESDFIDLIFPQSAIFERIELVRFSIGPLANLIRCAYRIFWKLPFDLILDHNEKILIYQKDLNKMLNENTNKGKVLEKLKDIEILSGQIYENIDKEIKNREEENKIGWFKKILKWGVILLMIYGVFQNFIGSNKETQEL